jgi:fatty acid desaturase
MKIPRERMLELSRLPAWGAAPDIILEWALIVLAVWLSERFWNPFLYLLVVMWIGARQHALGTLVHDAAHWRLFNQRKLNDFVGELFCAWPLFIRMEAYRYTHLKHHKHTGTPLDPEFTRDRYPTSRNELLAQLLRDVLGLNLLKQLEEAREMDRAPVTRETKILRALFYLVLFSGMTWLGGWRIFLLYWLIPTATWLKCIVRVRAVADHAGLAPKKGEAFYPTRTLIPNVFDRLFIAPRNVSYHLAHHLYMGVPSRNLAKLHEELLLQPDYRENARVTQGFSGLLGEF